MKTRVLVALATGCLLLAAASVVADDDAKKDLDALQGTWKFESLKAGEKEAPADEIKKLTFVIKDNKYSQRIDGEEDETGTIKVDPSKKPKTIDFDITSGKDKGKKQLAIYSIEGDRLTICLAGPGDTERPTKLEPTKDGKTALVVMKREKK